MGRWELGEASINVGVVENLIRERSGSSEFDAAVDVLRWPESL